MPDTIKFATLADMYHNSVGLFGERPAFSICGGEKVTYREFAERVEGLVDVFLEAGLSSGNKIVLYSNNMPNWAAAYFAAVVSGMVIVPVLPDFSGAEVDKIIRHSDAKALVVSDKLYSKISEEVIDELDLVVRTVTLIPVKFCPAEVRGKVSEPAHDDLAAIIYTSGTTSSPKGVMLSHGNLCSQLYMVNILQPIYENDVFLSILPLAHTFECSLGMLLPFMRGASVVYLDKPPTASVLIPAMRKVRPTIMLSVPLIIEKIYKGKILPQMSDSRFKAAIYKTSWGRKMFHRMAGKRLKTLFGGRVRFFGVGGAKLDPRVERFLFEAGFPYAIGYGLTETSPVLAGANPSMVRHQSTGPMLIGIMARLDNVNPDTGEGEIVVKGPTVMMGYYKNPEATADSFTSDGWFRTRDLGKFDKDGYLYIKGRLTNMILGPSGENIYPEEIEQVINSHPLINDSLVKEDSMGKLVAIVHFDTEALERQYNDMKEELGYRMEKIKHELIDYVNSQVSRFSRITSVEENIKGFEKTPTQKIKRFLYSHNSKDKKEEKEK